MTVTHSPQDSVNMAESKPAAVESHEKGTASDSSSSIDEPTPRLHAKTLLAVLAVCTIYFAQLTTLVGAGAVSSSITRE